MATLNPFKVTGAQSANREARDRFHDELASRQGASNLLSPGEIGGTYSAGRLLQTTLGGQIRAITQNDLKTFRQNIKQLGAKYRGGITAKDVIDLSNKIDRERAGDEIRTAIPMQTMGGRIHFVTNSGPFSKVSKHHVHIELLNYSAAISSPGKVADMVKALTTGALKFDCDCGRHTFWFRYIATVGQFNAGRNETAFPKIRNPTLVGVACKHVLRVMQQLTGPLVKVQIEKMIEAGRTNVEGKKRILSKKDAQAIADEQGKRQDWKRNKIESTSERGYRLAQASAIKTVTARSKAVLQSMSARNRAEAKQKFESAAAKPASMGGLTAKKLQAIMAILGKP